MSADRRKRVLLVDDDADFVAVNRTVLESNGFDVCTAFNGEECRQRLQSERPDLIVLDIMMASPGDGMFTAQDLKRDDATKSIPIIVVSSVNEEPAYNLGRDDAWLPVEAFLEKPVTPQRLLDEVKLRMSA